MNSRRLASLRARVGGERLRGDVDQLPEDRDRLPAHIAEERAGELHHDRAPVLANSSHHQIGHRPADEPLAVHGHELVPSIVGDERGATPEHLGQRPPGQPLGGRVPQRDAPRAIERDRRDRQRLDDPTQERIVRRDALGSGRDFPHRLIVRLVATALLRSARRASSAPRRGHIACLLQGRASTAQSRCWCDRPCRRPRSRRRPTSRGCASRRG